MAVYDDILVEYRINPQLPCKSLMERAKSRLLDIMAIKEPAEFFKEIDKKRDDFLDDAEDTAPVFDFFKGEQRKIFEAAVKNLAYFGNSKTYVSDQELLKVVEEIEVIVRNSKPLGEISVVSFPMLLVVCLEDTLFTRRVLCMQVENGI